MSHATIENAAHSCSTSTSGAAYSAASSAARADSFRAGTSTTMSAKQVHLHAVEAHRVGNRGRLALAQALRIIQESHGYKDLGHSGVSAYADAAFGMCRSETYSMIKVARALDGLPRCLEAFAEGKISWTLLRAIAEVASRETEEIWLEFAKHNSTGRLVAEAKDAKSKSRETPRKGGYGLPGLTRRITLRLTPSEHEKVRKVLEIFGRRAAEKLGSEDVSLEQALLLLCEQVLGEEAEEAGSVAGAAPLAKYALIYQACPRCRRGGVHTAEGLVEVDEEEIERIAGEADIEEVKGIDHAKEPGGSAASKQREIDRPTPPSLRRRMLLREGARCANPYCSNRADQVHHIRFRSEGGATNPVNLVATCATCHSLIHAGLLKVEGPAEDLRWHPRAEGLGSGRLRKHILSAEALPVFRVESTAVDSTAPADEHEYEEEVVATLRNLGWSTAQARSRARKSAALLGESPHTLEELIRTALSGRLPSRQSTTVDSSGQHPGLALTADAPSAVPQPPSP